MTNDAEAFLRAIDAAGDDPLPRLIFADWLEEQGRAQSARRLRMCPPLVKRHNDGGDDGDGGGDGGGGKHISRGLAMRDGLCIVTTPGGWSPYVVVAWCRVSDGWVSYLPGYRVIRRFGANVALSTLAASGPQTGTQLLPPSRYGGGCSTAAVSRYEIADPAAWASECPMPAEWKEYAHA